MTPSSRRVGILVASLVLGAACSHEPVTGPPAFTASASQPAGASLGTVTSALASTSATGLQRTVALPIDITVVRTIGSAGGVITIPTAGATVTVPAGALSGATQITMTARKGSLVAYDFAPHGITFAKPLVFTQRLVGTRATVLGAPLLRLGYYSDPSLLGATTGIVSELLDGALNLLNWSFTAQISHFSGYMVTCGRADSR